MTSENCIEPSSPEEQRVNQVIVSTLREELPMLFCQIIGGFLSLLIVILMLYHLDLILQAIKYLISGFIYVIGQIVYYYSIVVLRYVGAGFSGIGYDITESYCKLPYKLTYTYNLYVKTYKLSSNISYYDTDDYYNYCVKETEVAIYTFMTAHFFYFICMAINLFFINFSQTHVYPLYKTIMLKMNVNNVNGNNENNVSNEYEMVSLNERRRRYIIFDEVKFKIITIEFTGITYGTISVINFVIRKCLPYNSVSIYYQYAFLFAGLVICQVISLIYLVKITPYENENENNEV